MDFLLVLITAMVGSLVIIPLMARLAPHLGMIDHPDPRKVHARPIARVGGWGIVLGAVLALLVWTAPDRLLLSYLLGSLVLLCFGAWDDMRQIGHYTKFIGQAVAVGLVIGYGGLWVEVFPFVGSGTIPDTVAKIFTGFAMVGMINAMNHSDGLDGLAGGEALLSMLAIGLLAYIAGGELALAIAAAGIGAVLGFLRFNTHPATVFMGDGGSQFLGFTLGFLAVILTQRVDPSLSPAVVLLLLGLPIADILVVLAKRIRSGMNWFLATRNHLHHRLLDRGFVHRDSVVIIYSIQAGLVSLGVLLSHQSDAMAVGVYLLTCAVVFGALSLAERQGWQNRFAIGEHATGMSTLIGIATRRFLALGIPLYLLVGSVWSRDVPLDFGWAAALVGIAMGLQLSFGRRNQSSLRRLLIYVIAAFVVYLHFNYPSDWGGWVSPVEQLFFSVLALSVLLAVLFKPGRGDVEFRITATDYLMLSVLAGLVLYEQLHGGVNGRWLVYLMVIFYGCELLYIEARARWNALSLSSFASIVVLAFRGLI